MLGRVYVGESRCGRRQMLASTQESQSKAGGHTMGDFKVRLTFSDPF